MAGVKKYLDMKMKFIQVNGRIIKNMAGGNRNKGMGGYIQDNGKMIENMAGGISTIRMGHCILDCLKKDIDMDMAICMISLMISIWASLVEVVNMVKVNS